MVWATGERALDAPHQSLKLDAVLERVGEAMLDVEVTHCIKINLNGLRL